MANTFEDYTAISNQLDPSNAAYGFVFNFQYLEDTHVTVEVDGTLLSASNYTIQTSPDKRVLISSGVTVGQKVRVRRNSTADSDNPYVDFVNGSVLNETDQDNAYRHNLYLNEELAALNQQSLQKEVGGTNWDAQNLSIINLPTPTLSNEATSKTYVDTQVATAVNGSPQAPVKYAFTGDGSNAAFTFSPGVGLDADEMYEVAIDGVLQEPTVAYAIDANADTITFTSVPPNASKIVVINRGYLTPVIGAGITDGSVTTTKLANGSVTAAKISDSDSTFSIDGSGNMGLGIAANSAAKLYIAGTGGNTFLAVKSDTMAAIDLEDSGASTNQKHYQMVSLDGAFEVRQINDNLTLKATPLKVDANGDVDITGAYKVNGASLIPTGTVSAYAGATAPTGYALCDGAEYNQVGTYAALFAVLSTTYNTGGETANHFRVPDLKGRVIAGMGGSLLSATDAVADTGGAKEHTLTIDQIPSHTHAGTTQSGQQATSGGARPTNDLGNLTGATGGGQAHPNVQPTMILNYIIKI
jgi:microcystin-dependent protein